MSQHETADGRLNVLIAAPLEAAHVERIAQVDPSVHVLYAPELLPTPRYAADHIGVPPELGPEELERWHALLALADVSFDFDWRAPADMPTNCPRLTWVQATSAGIGPLLERTGLSDSDITFTTAAGVHAVPLAEFAVLGLLHFVKGVPDLLRWQSQRQWQRYTSRQLAGCRAVVVGLGAVGRHVVQALDALGIEVWGVGRSGGGADVAGLARRFTTAELDDALDGADALVLCCPLTDQTRGLVDGRRLRLLRPGGIVVNIARGPVVDEDALVEALSSGQLGGACLDVFREEPLPATSALWAMDNVIISPHSASTVETENVTLTTLFCENLRRWLDDQPLHNLYSRQKGY